MLKALLIVIAGAGGEYYVNMPDMPTCLEAKEVIYNQDPNLYSLCIPQEDDTKKVSEMFGSIWGRGLGGDLGILIHCSEILILIHCSEILFGGDLGI